jgi:hypothetical protein
LGVAEIALGRIMFIAKRL